MDCVWVPFRGWIGKTKYLSAFEQGMVVGAWRISNAAGFFTLNSFLCVSRMVHHPKDIQWTWQKLWDALESTWASIPGERFQHLEDSMPWRIEAVLRAKRGLVWASCCEFAIYKWSAQAESSGLSLVQDLLFFLLWTGGTRQHNTTLMTALASGGETHAKKELAISWEAHNCELMGHYVILFPH